MQKSEPGKSKQLYLLTQYMAFDKFSGREKEDLLEIMVHDWLRGNQNDDIWEQVAMYCESSFMLDRVTTAIKFPNRLSTAICCDILNVLSKRETKYKSDRRIKSTTLQSIGIMLLVNARLCICLPTLRNRPAESSTGGRAPEKI